MRGSVATGFQMNGICHASSADRKYSVTSLVCALVDPEFLAAECKHLGHERHFVQTASRIQSSQDLPSTTDLHPITRAQLLLTLHILSMKEFLTFINTTIS